MHLGRDVESRFALADAAVPLALLERLLLDFHVEGDVELAAVCEVLLNVLPRRHAIDRRAEAGAEERVVEVLADDGVIGAADAEDVHPAGDFAVGQQCPAGHRAVPVAVESAERQIARAAKVFASSCFIRMPLKNASGSQMQRTDAVPEIVAHRQPADERFDLVEQRRGLIEMTRWRDGRRLQRAIPRRRYIRNRCGRCIRRRAFIGSCHTRGGTSS